MLRGSMLRPSPLAPSPEAGWFHFRKGLEGKDCRKRQEINIGRENKIELRSKDQEKWSD